MAAGAVNVVLTTINFPNGGHGFTGHTSTPDLSGLKPVCRPGIASGDTAYYRYTIVVCALMFLLIAVHFATKPGRAWASIRESEPAALAAGVNIVRYKLWAFALASFTTGVAGALFAAQLGQPTAFGFPTQDSLTLLAAALIGGIYSLWGAVIAGAFSQLAPVHLPGRVGRRPQLPADHLRRRPAAGAADRSARDRRADAQGHPEPRAPRAHALPLASAGTRGSPMIEVEGLTVRFAGVTPIDDMSVVFPGRHLRPDRPERRGQDDVLQRPQRLRQAGRRHRSARSATTCSRWSTTVGPAGACGGPSRPRWRSSSCRCSTTSR